MCGIAGFWELKRTSDDAEGELGRMLDTLLHRGPDARGQLIDPTRGLAMGHTRLTIIDLLTGNQPLVTSDKKLVLTANGEFYDYKRHRAELACEEISFLTKTDSEIALPFYRKYELDFVHRLRGEFAIALFDADRQRFVLVRDRFGIKPLYYHLTNDALYYGSEVKAVLAHSLTPNRLCPKAVVHQMMQVMVPGTTAFEEIHALKPGHMLVVERDGERFKTQDIQYWDLDFPQKDEHETDRDPGYYVDRVRDLLIDAVGTRLEADVPVGCYLSGGIDSCSILGLATALQQSPVKAFTISFDHDDYDEANIAREMARKTGAVQEQIRLTAEDLYGEHFAKVVWHTERTFYNTLSVAKWHMSKRVRECAYKSVITGEGADELFGGYPFFKRDMYLHADASGHNEEAKAFDAVFQGAILAEEECAHPAWDELCGFTPSWIQPWMLTLEAAKPLFAGEIRDMLEDYDPIAAVAEAIDSAKVRGRHPLDVAQYTWSKTMLEGQILTWGGDRVDMANSMESRPAFLDHNVAEFAVRIPPTLRIRGGIEKWVLREAMKGVLPEVLYKRQKFAFMAPPSHTDERKREQVSRLVDQWLSPERLSEAGLFDRSKVDGFVEGWRRANEATDAKRIDILMNHLLQLHMLHEHFVGSGATACSAV